MKEISKKEVIDVEVWKSIILRRKITKPRFRINATKEQTFDMLYAAYQAEVEYRNQKFVMDGFTKKNLERLAEYLTGEKRKFGVMLCGLCGNGKTTMLYAFRDVLNVLVAKGFFSEEKEEGLDCNLHIIDAKEVQFYARDLEKFSTLKKRDMIGIEDMGREATEVMEYGNILSPIVDLLEFRYVSQSFTFITTNLTPKQIREKYGNRIADRMNEMVEVIHFENDTYRGKTND